MTVAADVATDYQHIDGIEVVTFTDLDADETASVYALRGGLNYRETMMAAAGAYQGVDMVWELWSATLGGKTPEAGCLVTDSNSVVYTIANAVETAIGQTSIKWRCLCQKRI